MGIDSDLEEALKRLRDGGDYYKELENYLKGLEIDTTDNPVDGVLFTNKGDEEVLKSYLTEKDYLKQCNIISFPSLNGKSNINGILLVKDSPAPSLKKAPPPRRMTKSQERRYSYSKESCIAKIVSSNSSVGLISYDFTGKIAEENTFSDFLESVGELRNSKNPGFNWIYKKEMITFLNEPITNPIILGKGLADDKVIQSYVNFFSNEKFLKNNGFESWKNRDMYNILNENYNSSEYKFWKDNEVKVKKLVLEHIIKRENDRLQLYLKYSEDMNSLMENLKFPYKKFKDIGSDYIFVDCLDRGVEHVVYKVYDRENDRYLAFKKEEFDSSKLDEVKELLAPDLNLDGFKEKLSQARKEHLGKVHKIKDKAHIVPVYQPIKFIYEGKEVRYSVHPLEDKNSVGFNHLNQSNSEEKGKRLIIPLVKALESLEDATHGDLTWKNTIIKESPSKYEVDDYSILLFDFGITNGFEGLNTANALSTISPESLAVRLKGKCDPPKTKGLQEIVKSAEVKDMTVQSNIYSLACMIYEVCTGETFIDGDFAFGNKRSYHLEKWMYGGIPHSEEQFDEEIKNSLIKHQADKLRKMEDKSFVNHRLSKIKDRKLRNILRKCLDPNPNKRYNDDGENQSYKPSKEKPRTAYENLLKDSSKLDYKK